MVLELTPLTTYHVFSISHYILAVGLSHAFKFYGFSFLCCIMYKQCFGAYKLYIYEYIRSFEQVFMWFLAIFRPDYLTRHILLSTTLTDYVWHGSLPVQRKHHGLIIYSCVSPHSYPHPLLPHDNDHLRSHSRRVYRLSSHQTVFHSRTHHRRAFIWLLQLPPVPQTPWRDSRRHLGDGVTTETLPRSQLSLRWHSLTIPRLT